MRTLSLYLIAIAASSCLLFHAQQLSESNITRFKNLTEHIIDVQIVDVTTKEAHSLRIDREKSSFFLNLPPLDTEKKYEITITLLPKSVSLLQKWGSYIGLGKKTEPISRTFHDIAIPRYDEIAIVYDGDQLSLETLRRTLPVAKPIPTPAPTPINVVVPKIEPISLQNLYPNPSVRRTPTPPSRGPSRSQTPSPGTQRRVAFESSCNQFIATTDSWLKESDRWIADTSAPWDNIGSFVPYAQKLVVNPGETVYVFGDFHGDAMALNTALKQLLKDGVIGQDYVIKEGNHLVFLGDYVDYKNMRGIYGINVWTALFGLRNANPNPNTLIIMRGNHEDKVMNANLGYIGRTEEFNGQPLHIAGELINKFGLSNKDVAEQVDLFTTDIYNRLPVALYLVCNNSTALLVHGGLELGFNPKPLLADTDSHKIFMALGELKRKTATEELSPVLQQELNNLPKNYKALDFMPKNPHDLHFLWNDFKTQDPTTGSPRGGSTWTMGPLLTKAILDRDGIQWVFRAHDHTLQPVEKGYFDTFHAQHVSVIFSMYDYCENYSFIKLKTADSFNNWKAWHEKDGEEKEIFLKKPTIEPSSQQVAPEAESV